MWYLIARIILRYRAVFIWLILATTYFMYQQSEHVRLSYEMARLLPDDSKTKVDYDYFVNKFGKRDNIMSVGVESNNFFKIQNFKLWGLMSDSLKSVEGVKNVISVNDALALQKDIKEKKFQLDKIFDHEKTQEELDLKVKQLSELPFYKKRFNTDSTAVLLIEIDNSYIESNKRVALINAIVDIVDYYAVQSNNTVHYSGLPYIRTINSELIKKEIGLFIFLAMLVTAIILFFFFKSVKVTLIAMLVVAIGVVWSFGSLAILNFEVTILTALIPPLLIVIGVPNSIFLINKYHNEYKRHGNKSKALIRMIRRVGNITILTNTTTALGFATFTLTSSQDLRQFGLVASINILTVFLLSLLLIPIVFSYLNPPKERHTEHLDRKWMLRVINQISFWVTHRRSVVFVYTIFIVLVSIFGLLSIKSTGNITDDIPKNSELYKGVKFFEEHYNYVLPFDIVIDTHRKNGVTKLSTLKRMDRLIDSLALYPEFSRTTSMVDVVKYAKQAIYNNNPDYYDLPNSQEKSWLMSYTNNSETPGQWTESFVDDELQVARISTQLTDIGTKQMNVIKKKLRTQVDQIFDAEKYDVRLTGASVVFLEGTKYLVSNLFTSLLLAILLISAFMAWMFNSFRMVMVSLIPNFIPLLLTAAIMGFAGIAIKPSTILVFSIAFGISVDDTIHFLAKFKQEMRYKNNIRASVMAAIKETGVSMIYTSIVLFFGFFIFIASQFGGTIALGLLVSITLMIALFSNLVVLPALLLSLERTLMAEMMQDPLMDIYEDEKDIDIESLSK